MNGKTRCQVSTFPHAIQDLEVPLAFQNVQLEVSDVTFRMCDIPSKESLLRIKLILFRQLVNFGK